MSQEEINEVAKVVAENAVKAIVNNTLFCTKAMLTSDEAAAYLGISKQYLYKLTSGRKMPFYKPMGKVVYFDRAELEAWIRENRISTESELNGEAQAYCIKKGGAI